MVDISDQTPTDGYLFPLFPRSFFPRQDVALRIWQGFDESFITASNNVNQFILDHQIDTAQDEALDQLGKWVGVKRLAGESNDAYRVRIPVTVHNGLNASNGIDMSALLTTSFNSFSTVEDISAGKFHVSIYGNVPSIPDALALIDSLKAAGTLYTADLYINDTGLGNLVGEFDVGEQSTEQNYIIVSMS